MAFTELTTDLNIIQALDDEPNDVGGLSAAELKAKFDEAANIIKTYLNETLIAEMEYAGAESLGITPISELPGVTDVENALKGIIVMLQDVTQGAVADGSITTAKLADLAVGTAKIADLAVTSDKLNAGAVITAKILDLAVTTAKLAAGAVTAEKLANNAVVTAAIANRAVTTDKIADANVTTVKIADTNVTTSKLAANAVTTAKIAAEAVTADKIGTSAVTAAKVATGAVSTVYTATIGTTWSGSAAPYTQTITVVGITANDKPIIDIIPSSTYSTAEEQLEAWASIYRIVTGADTITVYASEETTTAVPIQLLCVRR